MMHAGESAVRAFVRNPDQPERRRELSSAAPHGGDFDPIDTIAPRIPLREPRLVESIRQLELLHLSGFERAEPLEIRIDFV